MLQHISKWRTNRRKQWQGLDEVTRAAVRLLVVGAGIVLIGFVILYLIDPREGDEFSLRQLVSDLYANGGAELLSIALTVLLIERLNRHRAEQERKEELILQMGSPDNAFAVEAVRILRQKGWLSGTSLKEAHLWEANLQGADLGRANLQGANLGGANLQGADLGEANLQGVTLTFWGGVRFPICDEKTMFPDNTHWSFDRDWREFTHPEAWAAEQAKKRFTFSKPPGFARGK